MRYTTSCNSPAGELCLAASEKGLTGLWLAEQKYFAAGLPMDTVEQKDYPMLVQAVDWLESYFAGAKPNIQDLKLHPFGSPFRQEVWKRLCEIPYGEVTTYGALAKAMAKAAGKEKMSSQAVGGAVGHNPISIIIPCHRVIGSNGSLTGYAGGIKNKIYLLEHEDVDTSGFFVPEKGTAL